MDGLTCYTAIDVETTGLNPSRDKLIEVGAVRVRNGLAAEVFTSFVNPGRKLEERIVELTGIHDEDLRDAPDAAGVIPRLLDFIGEDVLVGHNLLFDYSFVKKAAVNLRLDFERQGVDTLKLARRLLPELESRNLGFLCRHYGIGHEAHRALGDALAASSLYLRLAEEYREGAPELFLPAPLVYKARREQPASRAQKERLSKLIELHRLEVDYEVDKLTRNEASRFTDQILSAYGR